MYISHQVVCQPFLTTSEGFSKSCQRKGFVKDTEFCMILVVQKMLTEILNLDSRVHICAKHCGNTSHEGGHSYSLLPKKPCCAKLSQLNLPNILYGQKVGEGIKIWYVFNS